MFGEDRFDLLRAGEFAGGRVSETAIDAGEFTASGPIGGGVHLGVELARECGELFLRPLRPGFGEAQDGGEGGGHLQENSKGGARSVSRKTPGRSRRIALPVTLKGRGS